MARRAVPLALRGARRPPAAAFAGAAAAAVFALSPRDDDEWRRLRVEEAKDRAYATLRDGFAALRRVAAPGMGMGGGRLSFLGSTTDSKPPKGADPIMDLNSDIGTSAPLGNGMVPAVAPGTPLEFSPGLFADAPPGDGHHHPHNIARSLQSTFLIHVELPLPPKAPRVGPASMARPGSLDRAQHGTGTGFVISTHGHILTNAHVLSPDCHSAREATHGLDRNAPRRITVQDSKGRKYAADVVGYDSLSDLAVLKVTAEISELSDHPPAKFVPLHFAPLPPTRAVEEDEEIEPGTQVCTIGNPKGLAYSVTSGILGSYPRPSAVLGKSDPGIDFLQTDAQVRKGNSGGPLLSLRTGHVLGITTTSFDPVAASAGGNDLATFAIRADATVRCLVRSMILGHPTQPTDPATLPPPPRPYLGLRTLDDLLLASLPERYEGWNGTLGGLLVMSLDPAGPAARAGLREGDLIVRVAGEPVGSGKEMYDRVYAFSPVCGRAAMRPPGTRVFSRVEVDVLRLRDGKRAEERIAVEPVELASGSAREREARVRFLASDE
ncbi:trypsin-like cysteine/serine peptidase domain-containing protein [Hyaloraphidium curvatum]|nr:trypsin-like cysteine/serine peptidase domain-containing protein [Hyaloraphidium curvatum]